MSLIEFDGQSEEYRGDPAGVEPGLHVDTVDYGRVVRLSFVRKDGSGFGAEFGRGDWGPDHLAVARMREFAAAILEENA